MTPAFRMSHCHGNTHQAFVILLRVHVGLAHPHRHQHTHALCISPPGIRARSRRSPRATRTYENFFHTGCKPSPSLCAHEGGGGHRQFRSEFLPYNGGGAKSLKPPTLFPASGCRSQQQQPRALQSSPPLRPSHVCPYHKLPACVTCQRLRPSAATCCSEGHHTSWYVDRRLPSTFC